MAKETKIIKCADCGISLTVTKFAPNIKLCFACKVKQGEEGVDEQVDLNTLPNQEAEVSSLTNLDGNPEPVTDGALPDLSAAPGGVDEANEVHKTRPPFPNPILDPRCQRPGCGSGKIRHAAGLKMGGAFWRCLICDYRWKTNAKGEFVD